MLTRFENYIKNIKGYSERTCSEYLKDLRAFALDDITGIRIRCVGIRYNPFEDSDDEDLLMGVKMISKMADVVTYTYALGMNTINIVFGTESK